jgi:hypothetical protein
MNILIYQSTQQDDLFTFSNPLVNLLQNDYPGVHVFHIDSFSDSFLLKQAHKLIEDPDTALFIILNQQNDHAPRQLAPLLMELKKNNSIKILSLYSNPLIEKIQKVEIFDSEDLLFDRIRIEVESYQRPPEKGNES